jgi:hypothetical protein
MIRVISREPWGAMVVARLVNDSALSDEILTVAASAFGGHTNNDQKRNAK